MIRNFITLAALMLCISSCGIKKTIADKFLNNAIPLKNDSLIEFTPTQYELLEIQKWEDKPINDLVNSVLSSDRAAFHNLAIRQLNGTDCFTKDQKLANSYFYKAASLGFAPSIEKIVAMYLNDYKNPFLAQVYVNIIATLGHTECLKYYNNLKDQMRAECGELLTGKIEKIAAGKIEMMLKNQTELAMANNDKAKFIFIMKNIVQDDLKEYNEDFWMKIIREGRKKK